MMTLTRRFVGRRKMLRGALGAGLFALVGCGDDPEGDDPEGDAGTASGSGGSSAGSGANGGASAGGTSSCSTIPEETAGPYPGDGSNGPNALTLSGIVRGDIRSSVGGASGTAEGVPLTVTLKIVGSDDVCSPRGGYAVYIWHCDRDGNYSMYSPAAADENYLRGVQETAPDGTVTFTTIFPGCYSGRWPHIHFEVYASLSDATSGANAVATSQIALTEESCDEVYATSGYESSIGTFAAVSLTTDMVFADSASAELATMSGDADGGFSASLTVPVGA